LIPNIQAFEVFYFRQCPIFIGQIGQEFKQVSAPGLGVLIAKWADRLQPLLDHFLGFRFFEALP